MMGPRELRELAKFATDAADRLDEGDHPNQIQVLQEKCSSQEEHILSLKKEVERLEKEAERWDARVETQKEAIMRLEDRVEQLCRDNSSLRSGR
jgi:archaellum component FlaC